MQCDAVAKRLDGFRTGELSASDRRIMAAHLSTCTDCARQLDDIKGLASGLARMRIKAPSSIFARVQEATADRYAAVQTDLGRFWVGFSARGVTMIDLAGGSPASFEDLYQKRLGRRPLRGDVPERYESAVRKAAAGSAPSAAPVDVSRLSAFEQEILRLLKQIPRGEVRPYSWLARAVGNPKAVRAVGNAMARNPVPLLLPCHRVVPTAGGIGRYASGPELKRVLLQREGAPVDEIEQNARAGIRYIGCKSTGIYCFPTCRDARRMRLQNRVLLRNISEASKGGFRPCHHCRPL
jgi:methylated-DNA-[protein]-cysteine S-methyltransferase